jgi:hypothetical protein
MGAVVELQPASSQISPSGHGGLEGYRRQVFDDLKGDVHSQQ